MIRSIARLAFYPLIAVAGTFLTSGCIVAPDHDEHEHDRAYQRHNEREYREHERHEAYRHCREAGERDCDDLLR
jgi:hypothetical protein